MGMCSLNFNLSHVFKATILTLIYDDEIINSIVRLINKHKQIAKEVNNNNYEEQMVL